MALYHICQSSECSNLTLFQHYHLCSYLLMRNNMANNYAQALCTLDKNVINYVSICNNLIIFGQLKQVSLLFQLYLSKYI